MRFKLQGQRTLKFHEAHVQQIVAKNQIPVHLLRFDSGTWQLVMAEVRTDSGKFVNSSWTCEVEGQRWWVVIGWGNTVEAILRMDRIDQTGLGSGIVTSGPLYIQVQTVNATLMSAEALGNEVPASEKRPGTARKSIPEKLPSSVAHLLKTVSKSDAQPRPKKFRTYQHLMWFARAVQTEVRLRQNVAVVARVQAATSDPELIAVLTDGRMQLQRHLHLLQGELGQAADAALKVLVQVQSAVSLGQAGAAASQGSAAERAEDLLQLLPPYRDLLPSSLSQGVPRYGEKLAEAMTRLVLAVAWERRVGVPVSRAAGTLTDWQRDQLEDEAERNSPSSTARGNGWASASANVSRNAWPILDPRARRFRG